MKKKNLSNTSYIFVMAVCIVFIVILSTGYILEINKIHNNNLNVMYEVVESSKVEMIKDIINNKIQEINTEKEYIYKRHEMYFKQLEKILNSLKDEELEADEEGKLSYYINTLIGTNVGVEAFVWNIEESNIVYTENNPKDKKIINNEEDLNDYISNYEFYIKRELKDTKRLIVIGLPKESLNKKIKDAIEDKLRSTRLNNDRYISIREVLDYNGGKKYVKSIVNPRNIKVEGKYKSIHEKDSEGNLIYKEELEQIKKYGEATYNISYEESGKVKTNIVYSKLYLEYNWIISTSINIDTIQNRFSKEINNFKEDVKNQVIITIITAVSCFFISGILANSLYNSRKARQRELDKQKDNIILQHYNILENKYEQTKQTIHDIKNHLMCIKGLAKDLGAKNVVEYVDSINNDINQLSYSIITGNRILDIVINEKIFLMKKNNINFIYEIQDIDLSFIEDKYICTIITNLLDNAIESCKKSESKNILLKIYCFNNGFIVIKLVNSCDEHPKLIKNRFITSKIEREFHGYGISNIKKSINKYSGSLDWEYKSETKEFHMVIMIPVPTKDINN